MKHFAYALAAASLGLFACGGSDDGGTPDGGTSGGPDANSMVEPTYTGTYNHYVTSVVKVGATSAEALSYGFPLDDLSPTMDNRIGSILGTFGTQLMLDTEIKAALEGGTFVLLHSVRADMLAADSSVQWTVYLGEPKMNPDLTSGNGMFTLKAGAPTNSKVGGQTAASKFTTTPAFAHSLTLEISLSAMSAPLQVTLVSPRVEATFSADGKTCSGHLGGALAVSDLENNIIPFLATQIDNRIGMDEGCRDALANCDSTSTTLLVLFDSGHPNGDRRITAAELKTNPTVQQVLNPDVDLDSPFGADKRDHVSIALGFNCTKAVFTATNEQ